MNEQGVAQFIGREVGSSSMGVTFIADLDRVKHYIVVIQLGDHIVSRLDVLSCHRVLLR